MSCGICLGDIERQRFVERSLVEGVPHTTIESRSRELGFPVKRETIRRHVKVCLTAEARAKSEAGRMLAAKRWTKSEVVKVEADAPPPPTTTAIAPPDLPDSDDFAVLVKARAVQMLKSGDLKVSTQDGIAAQNLLDRREEKKKDRELITQLGVLLSRGATPPPMIEEQNIIEGDYALVE